MITVLLLEENAAERRTMGDWLRQAGCHASFVETPAEVLSALSDEAVDVAVLDSKAEGGAGLVVARRLRATRPDLPLILTVRMSDMEAAVEAKTLGVIACLSRPVSREEFLEAIDQAYRWRTARKRRHSASVELRQEVAKRRTRLTRTFLQLKSDSFPALEQLMLQLTQNDQPAGLHACRVARMAAALGWLLGLREAAVADIERGALLHDVGKMALPDAVVRPSDPLSNVELELLRSHPRLGHDIVAVVPSLHDAAAIVLTTHERYDGSGFPRALRARDIPLGARITAVVEAFDAWTACGIHGSVISPQSAGTELVRFAGTHFDPDVVYAWLRLSESPSRFLDAKAAS